MKVLISGCFRKDEYNDDRTLSEFRDGITGSGEVWQRLAAATPVAQVTNQLGL
jgi:hypothetical protein